MGQEVKGHFTTASRPVVANLCILLIVLILAGALYTASQSPLPATVDQSRVGKNQQMLERCEANRDSCLGMFAKFSDGKIFFVENYAGISFIYSKAGDIDYIVYPNTQRWSGIAVDYAQQFVTPR